jgi:4,5-DOPA dioxygenase extradiol
VKKKIEQRDHRALIDFEKLDPDVALAVPSAEHFLPLLYVLAAQDPNESATFFNDRIVMGAISMTGVAIGA